MTVNFTDQFKKQLQTWIDASKRIKFTLLYKATRDGCVSTTFNNQCDNKGPTVTVLYNTNNSVYGGYTSVSWNSNNTYSNDANAFLFRLNYNGTFQPIKFPVTSATNAICCYSSYGPTFGNGHDLYTFSNTVYQSGNYFALNGYFNPNYAYNWQGLDSYSVANGHLNVTDIEVYLVEEDTSGKTNNDVIKPKRPWRRNIEWSTKVMKEVKEAVVKYKPLRDLNVPQARILLIGQVGAGKSSFFNTINSIFRGYITGQANSGSAEHSLTTLFRMYQVRNGQEGKPLNFRLCDTRGLEDDQGTDVNEIGYVLDGHVPDKYQFNPAVPMSPGVHGWLKLPKLADKIHCVAFVVDSTTIDVMSEKILEKLKRLQALMNQKGIPQVVLMTKIDKISEIVSDDVSDVFSNPAIKDCVDKVSTVMGLPRSHILPMKNYECEMDLETNVNILSLLNLKQILNFTDDYMYNFLDDMDQMNIRE